MGIKRELTRARRTIYVLIIVLLTGVVFSPAISSEFLIWDDEHYVVHNNVIKDFSFRNLKKMFTSSFVGCYCPLAILSYAVEYYFFKLNPSLYHLTNYLLHILISLLVFYFIYLLSDKLGVAFIGALIFGVHTVHVESVAWISERKDLLCALFYILALITYSLYLKHQRRVFYFGCVISAILALLSKPMAVTIPLALMLSDYFYGGKVNIRSILVKWPFFLAAAFIAILNIHFQRPDWGIVLKDYYFYFLSKAILFYLSKFALPVKLSAMYAYRDVSAEQMAMIKYYVAAIILLAGLVLYSGRYTRKIIFGGAFFFITILPVLKIVPVSSAFAADRYMYIPSIGICYVLAVVFARLFYIRGKALRFIAVSFLVLWIATLSFLTWRRCYIWKTPVTFGESGISQTPDFPGFYNNLGIAYTRKKRFSEAIDVYKKTLKLHPNDVMALLNFSTTYIDAGEYNKALEQLRKALEIKPNSASAHFYSGLAFIHLGNKKKAMESWKKTIELDPKHGGAYYNLSLAYYRARKYDLAIKYCDLALEYGFGVNPKLIEELRPYRKE